MIRKIIILFAVLTFGLFTQAAGQGNSNDSAQQILINDIVAKINEHDLVNTAQNEVLSQQIVFDPISNKLFVLNRGSASIDIYDQGQKGDSLIPLSIDALAYGGRPFALAYGSGVLGVLIREKEKPDQLLCLGNDGRYLRTFALDTAMQGIFFNAFSSQFIIYRTAAYGYKLITINFKGGPAYLASAKMRVTDYMKAGHGESSADRMRRIDPLGLEMTLIAMIVVFSSLLLLYLVFKYIGRIYRMNLRTSFRSRKKKEATILTVEVRDHESEVVAAIGLALHMYKNQLHDYENTVLTIKKATRAYSPWSSKIYGIMNQLKKEAMKQYKFTIHGNEYEVEIQQIEDNMATVAVNGQVYEVEVDQSMQQVKPPKRVTAPVTSSITGGVATEKPAPKKDSGNASPIKAPLPGTILEMHVKVGDAVKLGQKLLILEAMKMENNVESDKDGSVKEVRCQKGDSVMEGDVLVVIG